MKQLKIVFLEKYNTVETLIKPLKINEELDTH